MMTTAKKKTAVASENVFLLIEKVEDQAVSSM